MIITLDDARAFGYCASGMRKFAARNSLDWSKFIKEGLPEEVLVATGEAMAIRLVEKVNELRR